ncbi:protein ALP1-like [Quercus robur]|uniref:protein ALP1-like n=1 Tax=Quercus robur TaxID=38942 RepID=UPI002162C50F|nr:protein ALP1-like [Quercus robur]
MARESWSQETPEKEQWAVGDRLLSPIGVIVLHHDFQLLSPIAIVVLHHDFQVNAAAEVIYDLVDPSANLIFGAVIDQSLSGQDCIGAIDGTHIQVVGDDKKAPYYNRKGVTSFNVMVVCDFDLLFTFVMAGWEGAVHDTRIFLDVIHRQSVNFPKPPPGKYYLVDAGYPLRKGYLPPYKGQRYHLLDFRRAGRGNHIEERFNYVHSSLRSAIERTFGVWKNKWKILKQMPPYDIKHQRNIIVATCVLHNFIRKHDREDEGFNWDEHDLDRPRSNSSGEGSSRQANVDNIQDEEMKFVRDKIARSICGL